PATRDQRTVFVSQLPQTARGADVSHYFAGHGLVVRDVRLVMDRMTDRPKGFGFVEFQTQDDAARAFQFAGGTILGNVINVSPADTHHGGGRGSAGAHGAVGPPESQLRRVYVGSLHYDILEADVHAIFSPFGPIDLVKLQTDAVTGRSRGFAFVHFRHLEDANRAIATMDGHLLLGRRITVGRVGTRSRGQPSPYGYDAGHPPLSTPSTPATASNPSTAFGSPVVPKRVYTAQRPPPAPPACGLLLTDMFDPDDEDEPGWDADVAADIRSEVAKYGTVTHLALDLNSRGDTYVRYATRDAAEAAKRALDGRWYNGAQIAISFVHDADYRA
ncbi:hypothetical protein CXG81DRAFT_6570, partial [Caulochytrium protostelioides]